MANVNTALTTISTNTFSLASAEKTLKNVCDKSSEWALKIGIVLLAVKNGKLWKEKYESLLDFYNAYGISTSDASRKMQIVRKLYDETIDETGAKQYVCKMKAFEEYNYSQLAEIARYEDEETLLALMENITPETSRGDIRKELNNLIMARRDAKEYEAEETEETEETEKTEETEETTNAEEETALKLIDIVQTISDKADALINKKRPTKAEKEWLNTFTEWVKTTNNLYAEE